MLAGLRARAEAWLAGDPDPGDRAELRELLAAGEEPGPAGERARAELADRFAGRLRFGTAGLRGALGAGPNRMNRAVVRAATAALAGWLTGRDPAAAAAGVVIGCDARHRSEEFALETAAVLTGAGVRVHLLPRPGPTPLLAFAVRHLGAAAGVMITASHNPPADNGYKLYLGDGAQIVPPADEEIETAIGRLGPLTAIPIGPPGGPLEVQHGDEVAAAYLDAVTTAIPGPVPAGPAPGRAAAPPPGPAARGTGRAVPGTGRAVPGTGRAVPGTGRAVRGSASAGSGTAAAVPGAEPPTSSGAHPAALRVVYTPLHGVAAALALRAIERAGFPRPAVVAAQAEPDPDFPTVAFPNPEEPGALGLALAEARATGADLVLANDPDGDRLAVAVPDTTAAGGWRVLTGDQLGGLLGAFLLERTSGNGQPGQRLVVTTVVSSTLLGKIAAAAGARCAVTLTGFKWIVRGAERVPGSRFLFGYEEALGYAIGTVVRDKDGIGAALAVLSLAASARAAGQTLAGRWDELELAHGVHLTAQVTLATRAPAEVMARLRAHPPAALAGQPVTGLSDLAPGADGLPPADVLTFRLAGARVVVRPSGTEPKLKAYLEVVEPVGDRPLTAARAAAAARLTPLRMAVTSLLTGAG